MKIVAVEPFVVGTSWRNLVFVRVRMDDGLERPSHPSGRRGPAGEASLVH